MNNVLQYSGFGISFAGFSLMSFDLLLPGLVVSIVGNTILILYGYVTNQPALWIANVLYNAVALAGAYKYFF